MGHLTTTKSSSWTSCPSCTPIQKSSGPDSCDPSTTPASVVEGPLTPDPSPSRGEGRSRVILATASKRLVAAFSGMLRLLRDEGLNPAPQKGLVAQRSAKVPLQSADRVEILRRAGIAAARRSKARQ